MRKIAAIPLKTCPVTERRMRTNLRHRRISRFISQIFRYEHYKRAVQSAHLTDEPKVFPHTACLNVKYCTHLQNDYIIRRDMKNIVPTFILLLASQGLFAQSKVTFGYDGAGNRISRSASSVSKKVRKSRSGVTDGAPKTSATSLGSLSVTYSQSRDVLSVTSVPTNTQCTCHLTIHTVDGSEVYSADMGCVRMQIPFSRFPNGVYIVSVSCGGHSVSRKVTK